MHVQVRLRAARQHDPQAGGTPGDEQLQPRQRLRRLQLVQVVDHEHQRLFERTKVLQQPFDHRLAAKPGSRAERLDGAAESRRERVGHREPEVLRVSFAAARPRPTPCARRPRCPRATSARASSCRCLRERRQEAHSRFGPATVARTAPRDARDARGWTALAPVRAGPCRGPHCDPSQASISVERRRRNGRQTMGARRTHRLGPPRR